MDVVFATRRIGTDAVFARLFFSAADANAPGGTGTSTGSGSGGAATGATAGVVDGGTGTSVGSGSGGSATGTSGGDASADGGGGISTGSGSGGVATGEGTFTGSLSDADIARIAAAVLAALQASVVPFPADIVQINSKPITGSGTPADPMRPA